MRGRGASRHSPSVLRSTHPPLFQFFCFDLIKSSRGFSPLYASFLLKTTQPHEYRAAYLMNTALRISYVNLELFLSWFNEVKLQLPIKSIHRNYLFLLYEFCIRQPYTHSFSEIVRTGAVILHPHIDITVDDAPLKTAVASFNARCNWLISCYSDRGRSRAAPSSLWTGHVCKTLDISLVFD